MKNNNLLPFVLILYLRFLVNLFLLLNIYPASLSNDKLLFAELLNYKLSFYYYFLYLLDGINLFLIYLISQRLFKNYLIYIPVLVYSISPWVGYLIIGHSPYIFYLFLVLLGFYGHLLLGVNKKTSGLILFGSSLLMGLYSSMHFMIIIPILLVALYLGRELLLNKKQLLLITLLSIPLLWMIVNNFAGFSNIISKEIGLFDDPGLLATVNKFQGEARADGYLVLARLSENRYIFSFEYIIIKTMENLSLGSYFTPEGKLLGFSFVPPLWLGLTIPFVYALYLLLIKNKKRVHIVFIPLLFIIPSLLSSEIVDLTRLILTLPFIIFIISFGFAEFIKNCNNKYLKIVFVVSLVLTLFQLIVASFDVKYHERARYLKVANEKELTF